MAHTMPTTISDLLDEMEDGNPEPQERWLHRDDFDPMHRMEDLRKAAARGLIELEVNEPREATRFRFTTAGRHHLAQERARA